MQRQTHIHRQKKKKKVGDADKARRTNKYNTQADKKRVGDADREGHTYRYNTQADKKSGGCRQSQTHIQVQYTGKEKEWGMPTETDTHTGIIHRQTKRVGDADRDRHTYKYITQAAKKKSGGCRQRQTHIQVQYTGRQKEWGMPTEPDTDTGTIHRQTKRVGDADRARRTYRHGTTASHWRKKRGKKFGVGGGLGGSKNTITDRQAKTILT